MENFIRKSAQKRLEIRLFRMYCKAMETPSFTQNDLNKMPKDKLVEITLALLNNQTELMNQISVLTEEIKVMNQRKYGRKTESVPAFQMYFDFGFNEAEASADEDVPEPAIEETTRRAHSKKKGKREDFLGKITKQKDVSVEIDEEKLDQMFGKGNYKKLPEELIQKLEHHPESFEVINYHIAVYARKDFTVKGNELDNGQAIVRAPRPTELWQHSYVTPSLLSSILFAKYVNAVPLYRQEQAFAGSGIDISRVNMANWIIKVSDLYLRKYYDVMHKKLQEQKYIHADETPVQVNKEKELGNKKQYMWVYRTEPLINGPQIVLYDYRPGRKAEYCGDFLQDFNGTATTDGYEVYHKLARENASRFKVAGCWVHAKRKMMDVVKAEGSGKSPPVLAKMAVSKISTIFHENNKLNDLPAEERLKRRQSEIKPLVDDFYAWVRREKDNVLPHSRTGEAFTYILNQEKFLRVFLSDPYVPMDNSAAERAIRPFTIGRKNWVMIDTPKGADASAVV